MPSPFTRSFRLVILLCAGSAVALLGCDQQPDQPPPPTDAHADHEHADHTDHDHGHTDGAHTHAEADAETPAGTPAAARPLEAALSARKAEAAAKMPADALALHEGGIKQVAESGVLDTAKVVGDRAPDFTLRDLEGRDVMLSELLKGGPVVLTWYRGGWCPYCNITLRSYQQHLDEFRARGGQLVALSPEVYSHAVTTAKEQDLGFAVLHDEGSKVAEQYGIAFTLPAEVAEAYEKGFGLSDYNGDTSARLPLAATYVIDQGGVIRWAFVSADYRQRAEPADIIGALDTLKN